MCLHYNWLDALPWSISQPHSQTLRSSSVHLQQTGKDRYPGREARDQRKPESFYRPEERSDKLLLLIRRLGGIVKKITHTHSNKLAREKRKKLRAWKSKEAVKIGPVLVFRSFSERKKGRKESRCLIFFWDEKHFPSGSKYQKKGAERLNYFRLFLNRKVLIGS